MDILKIGTKLVVVDSDNTGLKSGYQFTVKTITDNDPAYVEFMGMCTYHDELGYGVDHIWAEKGYVEVLK